MTEHRLLIYALLLSFVCLLVLVGQEAVFLHHVIAQLTHDLKGANS